MLTVFFYQWLRIYTDSLITLKSGTLSYQRSWNTFASSVTSGYTSEVTGPQLTKASDWCDRVERRIAASERARLTSLEAGRSLNVWYTRTNTLTAQFNRQLDQLSSKGQVVRNAEVEVEAFRYAQESINRNKNQ